ncbi:hypothetical protein K504DRAFT_438828 [Pleomassaria siparia CBS 279.74]|uniref:Uncharacterized protein n=1 Tax=Pleomassaria siparia CBS 279.74 TaxID=1314801 RepID=A0A6G1K0V8_9PLEO|nr:hypothetical protein K504DRAFT_438828 [Pleomassaria siparia CBS 279.74]
MAGIDNDATPAAHANDNDNGDEGVGDGNDDTRAANITPAVNITPVLDDGRQFRCMNDEFSPCQTGQYTMNLSRKVISNHFGRNKACTRLVKDWPLFCRKHYQRATYKPQLWQRRKVNLILRQFDIIEEQLKETLKEQFKGITYNVHLKKAEEARLNEFSRKVANGISYETAAEAVAANTKVKSFQAPIKVLRELENFLGDGKDLETCQEAMKVILDMLSKGETSEVPSIEFLPNIPPEAATVSRINAKGGIQRPRCT